MKYFYLLVVLASVFSATAQNRKLDSLNQELINHPAEDTTRVKVLCAICYYEIKIDPEKAKDLATEALRISETLKFKRGIGYSQRALAGYYRENGDYALASEHAFEMLKVFEGTDDKSGWGQANQLLGIINQEMHNTDKAKEYYIKAVDIFEKADLKRQMSFLYNSLGALYLDLKDYDEALRYEFKCLAIRESLNIHDQLFMNANIATTYKLKNDYQHALEFFNKDVPALKTTPFKNNKAIAYIELGDLYSIMGDYRNAELYLNEALALGKELKHKRILFETYEKLMLLEKRRHHFEDALDYQILSDKYSDSIFTEENGKKLSELEVRYESGQKDQTIREMKHQEDIRKLRQLYLFGALLLVILIILALYLQQRRHNSKVNSLLDIQKSLNGKLKESDQLKTKFFANISHELRTPLTLIIAPIEEKLSASKLSAPDRQSFQLIRRNAGRLLGLINQLLDLSKLEARKMQLEIRRGDLRQLVGVLASSFDSLAEFREVEFQKEINLSFTETWFDADKVEKIVNNLLANSIKFTPRRGSVRFLVSNHSDTEIMLRVTDTGRGIPVHEQENVFEPFYQSRQNDEDSQSGTGLGLPLVKEVVKLYGGTIELWSEVGLGTVITVVLPVVRNRFDESVIAPSEVSADLPKENDIEIVSDQAEKDSILIVEDNIELRYYMASLLGDAYTILTAGDGEEGFALACEHIPSLILSDVMMPKLSGIDLVTKIKSEEITSHIPVILLTAKADDESKLEGLQTGADDYLAKPFNVSELRVRINNLIEQRNKLAAKYQTNIDSVPGVETKELSMDDKFLTKVKQIVDENLGNSQFSVEQLASEVNLSRTQLFRKLKALSNFSPNELINEIRLQRAAELIRRKADNLTQIGYQVGYSEQSYFAKRFRKKFGVTPSEYQSRSETKK